MMPLAYSVGQQTTGLWWRQFTQTAHSSLQNKYAYCHRPARRLHTVGRNRCSVGEMDTITFIRFA